MRHAYWTILIDDKPTAFRARERDELLPTLRQLQGKNPSAQLQWFERGRLWGSPFEAKAAARTPHRREQPVGRAGPTGSARPGRAVEPRPHLTPSRTASPQPPSSLFHIVLLQPRAGLPSAEREALWRALTKARLEIPTLRRFRVGKRVLHGPAYETERQQPFTFAAILEFDDVAGLTAYLSHPAHRELGRRFGATAETALVYDFEMWDPSDPEASRVLR